MALARGLPALGLEQAMRYVVCYDMIVSGSVEIEADSLESAEETFGNMGLDELRAGLTGKPDLLTDSIQIAED